MSKVNTDPTMSEANTKLTEAMERFSRVAEKLTRVLEPPEETTKPYIERNEEPIILITESISPIEGQSKGDTLVEIELEKDLEGIESVKFGEADALEFDFNPQKPKILAVKTAPGKAGEVVQIKIINGYLDSYVLDKPFTYT